MAIWNWFKKRNKKLKNHTHQDAPIEPITSNLEANINSILHELGNSCDIVVRRFTIKDPTHIKAAVIYTDGLVNTDHIYSFLKNLLTNFPTDVKGGIIPAYIKEQVLNAAEVKELEDRIKIINEIISGSTAILIENSPKAIIANTKGGEYRSIAEPDNQLVLRGPKEGFTENIRTNTALIRRIVSTSKLRIEQHKIGTLSETAIDILYIEGIAHPKIVEEVRRRIKRIKTDTIMGSGFIGEFLQDSVWTLFPLINYSERPDSSSAQLFEGKVIVLVNGSPFAITLPVTFWMFLQSPDDYYLEWHLSSFLRILRMVTYFLSLTLPSLYVAVITFHPEVIPTTLLVSLAGQREGIPFPTFVEALLMELTFEILREAGVRMPRAIGQAVSIVGALVLGTAAVEAGIVSSTMVIIVSMTAISSFTAPYIELATTSRIIRFGLLLLGASFGLFGILFGLMVVGVHLSSLRSFGIPYTAGVAPFNLNDQKDLFVRIPWFLMEKRPRLSGQQNPIRQDLETSKHPKKRTFLNKEKGDKK